MLTPREPRIILLLALILGAAAGCTEPVESEEDDTLESEPSMEAESPHDWQSEIQLATDSKCDFQVPPWKCTTPSCRKLGSPVKTESHPSD